MFNAPKKSLGQNFLKSENVRNLIVKKVGEVVDDNSDVDLVEIGPGRGFITQGLLSISDHFRNIILAEKDDELVEFLHKWSETQKLGNKVKIVAGDFLEFDLRQLGKKYIAYGSLPYNVSKKIIDMLITSPNPPLYSLFIIQKEVAEDYASTGNKKFLGAYSELYAKGRILKNIPPQWFNPRPKVDSSLIEFVPVNLDLSLEERGRVRKLMRAGYTQPRKTLFNNLKSIVDKDLLQNWINENFGDVIPRPSDLTREQWIELAEKVKK